MQTDFDVVVIGGGHAGIEAAAASARLGCATALVTLRPETIGQMSCNPAIGGVGKGQIVREIDALDGLMGRAADATGIQFRMLNRSKGPAVWGPRCQSDRHAYAAWMQAALAGLANLTVLAAEATGLVVEGDRVVGVRLAPPPQRGPEEAGRDAAACDARAGLEERTLQPGGAVDRPRELACRAAVVTAGTFLNGLMHIGERTFAGGRYGEPAAAALSDSLQACGLELQRLKTGTCPRVAAETIDTEQCTRQDGDESPVPFSFLHDALAVEPMPCWITQTNPGVHERVRANLHRAPMFTGQISSSGPRYCPSFETKLVRFSEKSSHQIFLEPEGRTTNWVYCNGIPTSLPVDVQAEMVAGIAGLQRAEVLRWGYAIEYDYAPPTQLTADLQTKTTAGLYLAGQINGTTGYEEAGGQGLIAGANAARAALGMGEAIVLGRQQAYIGVMIDDLVTKGVTEPYRMFTSRAEYRLALRADNADRRLTPLGRELGLVGDARFSAYGAKADAAAELAEALDRLKLDGKPLSAGLQDPRQDLPALVARLPGPAGERLAGLLARHPVAAETVATDARYAGYLRKEQAMLKRMGDLDARPIRPDVDYAGISHLRHEAREKLAAVRPRTLGQALRVSGITPADVNCLAIHLAGSQGGRRG